MKVVKKTAVKAKSPAKQYIDPNAKKREQDRQSKMTVNQRKEEGSKVSGPNRDSMPGKAPKKPEPVKGRKEGAGPMQLKSSAKTAPAKMKKC